MKLFRILPISLGLLSLSLLMGFPSQVGRLPRLPNTLPEQSCKDAQAVGLFYEQSIPTPEAPPVPLPFPQALDVRSPAKLPSISLQNHSVHVQNFMPQDLTLQPFEGYPEDIAHVGQVLRDADNGKRIRLTFFGASHTAGDFWTGHIRRVLQARYGDIGHGFVMPIPMASGSRGHDINLCASEGWTRDYVGKTDGHNDSYFGLGMSASSDDPTHFAWAETTHQNPVGRQISSIHLFTLGSFGGGSFLAQVDQSNPFLLSTHSENPTLQHTKLEVNPNGHRITLSPVGDGTARLLGLSLESDGPGALVDSIGIQGRTASTWLKWDEDLMRDMLSVLEPDLVVLAYGTNEANDTDYTMEHYEEDLRAVLSKFRRVRPNSACILAGPSDRGKVTTDRKGRKEYTVWERTHMVAEVQRHVAPDFDCVFWDWQQATGGIGSMIAWQHTSPSLSSEDLIHFTPQGYQISAEQFLLALDDAASHFLPTSKKSRQRFWKK